MATRYRLGLDLGVNSLGWCALALDDKGEPCDVLVMGVRLFTDGRDPKTGTSLAADRRIARQMRRRRDRYLKRRSRLLELLVAHGLMPADEGERKRLEARDPYALRAKGLDEKLEPYSLGRALFHLNQRRGFKSSRKTDKGGDEKERGKIDIGARKLKEALAESGLRTLGEYLAKRHAARTATRVRPVGKGAKAEYPFYPLRALVEDEFERLWAAQAAHHLALLTQEAKAAIKDAIFHQRPLRAVDPGLCTLDPSDERAPWALPLAQRFRMLQEINHLEIIGRDLKGWKLTLAQRDKIYAKLRSKKELTFEQMRRLLDLDSSVTFNLESARRQGLKGDGVGRLLEDKTRFGKAWWTRGDAEQDAIAEAIIGAEDEEALAVRLESEWGLHAEQARATARVGLPDGYCRLGRKALAKVVKELMSGFTEAVDPATGEIFQAPLTYAQAVERAGYHHSDFRGDGSAPALDYYGKPLERHMIGASGAPDAMEEKRYGRFPNPTVHIGLNELRKVVNAIIATHGKPAEVAIELARDLKLSREERKRVDERINADTERNVELRKELESLGQKVNRDNLQRLKLYHELPPQQRCCVYTGKPLSVGMLFSDAVAIDHILPFKATLDDSLANKVLCLRQANHDKGKRTPYEAFHAHGGYDWKDILLRAEILPKNKRWRFAEDALQRFAENADFIARHLTDTAYVAKIAKEYLGQICPSDRVWASPGKLTALLRGKWGLNGILSDSNLKNRADHRHHAIDAFVVGCTSRSLLKRMSDAAAAARLDRELEDLPEPWDGFDRDAFRETVRAIVVSLRPDHGRQGRLHEETAYGLIADPTKEEGATVVYRKAFADLNENEIARIRDADLRTHVTAHVDAARAAKGGKLSPVEISEALAAFAAAEGKYHGIRHVRLRKTEDPATLIRIADRQGRPYKALMPGENWCIDIYEQPDETWVGVPVTVFEANQPAAMNAALNRLRRERLLHPTARKVMSIQKGDYLKLEPKENEPEAIMRVVRLEPSANRIRLAEHKEAGNLGDRHADEDDYFRWVFVSLNLLKRRKARSVTIDPLGRVRDPGPPKPRAAAAE